MPARLFTSAKSPAARRRGQSSPSEHDWRQVNKSFVRRSVETMQPMRGQLPDAQAAADRCNALDRSESPTIAANRRGQTSIKSRSIGTSNASVGLLRRTIMKSFILILAIFASAISAYQPAFAQYGVTSVPGSDANAAVFGPANSRPNLGTNGPGRAGNLPVPGGSLNGNSAFQLTTNPFAHT